MNAKLAKDTSTIREAWSEKERQARRQVAALMQGRLKALTVIDVFPGESQFLATEHREPMRRH